MKKLVIIILFLLLIPKSLWAETLSEKLSGRILIQTETKGEAWYVYPQNQQRFYLGKPDDAWQVMKKLGLGVSNQDLNSFNQTLAPQKLAGYILLKIQANGEAYYVNPLDLKLYYLGRPTDAWQIMRNLGLGISNQDLSQILIAGDYFKVTRVIDGDTVVVIIDNQDETVRLIGIDTPETVHPTKPMQCFGPEASQAAKKYLTNQTVRLEIDQTQGERDKYHRLLRYLFLTNGDNFNKLMITDGFAHEYTYKTPYFYQTEFKQAEQEAKNNKRGLWKSC